LTIGAGFSHIHTMKSDQHPKVPGTPPGRIVPVNFTPVEHVPQFTLACVKFDQAKNLWAEVDERNWTRIIRHFRCAHLHQVEFKVSTAPIIGIAKGWLQEPTLEPLHFHFDHFCDDKGAMIREAQTLLLMPGRGAYFQAFVASATAT
jgi:hypothetical protein